MIKIVGFTRGVKKKMVENNNRIKGCIYTIYDNAIALYYEGMQSQVSREYCKEKIDIIEHDIICIKHRLGIDG